jgi:hypothetical protein
MASFKKYYRSIFQTFGYPLTERAAMSPDVLTAAGKRLGVKIPAALRDYYLVAGRERRFNLCHNRLLPPTKWEVDKHRIIFMEENQRIAWWGVSTRNPGSEDPPVSEGFVDEPIDWRPQHRKCSAFLAFMLHYQAVCDGFRFCGSASVPEGARYRFEERGWMYYGEANLMRAYSRPNQVVFLMPPGDLPFMQRWSVFAGGKTKADLRVVAEELGVTFT